MQSTVAMKVNKFQHKYRGFIKIGVISKKFFWPLDGVRADAPMITPSNDIFSFKSQVRFSV